MNDIKLYILKYFINYECVFAHNNEYGIDYSFRIDDDNDIFVSLYKRYLIISLNSDDVNYKYPIITDGFNAQLDDAIKISYKDIYVKINRSRIIKNIIA